MKRNPLIGFAVIAVVGIVLILVMGVWGGHTARERATGSDKAKTAALTPDKIFQQNCSSCHGNNLEGGVGPNLQKIGGQLSKDRILTQIQKGGGGMPGGIIAGKEADQVATWLSKKK